MKSVVDTPIWSGAFRRQPGPTPESRALALALRDMIAAGDAILLGAVRQEVLSGIVDEGRFRELRDRLRALPDDPPGLGDYELAAYSFNQCTTHGVAATGTDMLICAVASRLDASVLTLDADFAQYADILAIRLHTLSRRTP